MFLIFYSIPFYFIQYVCLSNNAVFFFASLHSQPHRLRSHGYCVCVVVTWIGAMSPAGNTSSHTIRVQFPLLLFSPIVPVFKCRKNRYPLINSKAVKILSSPKRSRVLVKKCWTSHCLHGTKKRSSLQVESLGVKHRVTKNVPLLRRIKVERLYNVNDMFP